MEDVIFAGTQLRKPQGFAYVAITINNEDHKLKVPYEEVKIARRVYRSGESEYLLNGASCRLRDIQELLLDTGIGKEGYSIIGQGQIDKILSGKPEERRELFDEAAGIVKFKKRKTVAEKNLEEEQQNLVRIEDILSELEKQVEPLEAQSEKAKEYLSYRDELRNLDINVFLQDYKENSASMEELREKESIADGDLAKTKEEYETVKTEYIQLEEALDKHTRNLEECRETLSADKVKLNQQEGDIKVLEEQINAVRQSELYYREQIENYRAKVSELESEQEEHRAKTKEFEDKLQQMEHKTQTAGLQEILDREQSNLQEISDKIQALDDAGAELAHSVKHMQGQTEQLNLERRETERQYHMDHSRLRSLQNMTERYEGFGQSIKRVMEQKPNYPGISELWQILSA